MGFLKMRLNIGNKLLCKKDTKINNGFSRDFKHGKLYTIIDLYTVYAAQDLGPSAACEKSPDNQNDNQIITKYAVSDLLGTDWWFTNHSTDWYIWKYFYTPQEIRKLKLKQLNNAEGR